jgi:hypothetical protein
MLLPKSLWQSLSDIVKSRTHYPREAELPREFLYRINDALVKVQDQYSLRSSFDQASFVKVHDAKRNRISVPNENDISMVEQIANVVGLEEHVRNFHIDLIELADRRGTINNDVGNCI